MPTWAIGIFILEGLVILYFAGATIYCWHRYEEAQARRNSLETQLKEAHDGSVH
jgi:hypothetical protein